MDWLHQDRFRNWLILLLLVLNLITVSIIWMQTARKTELPVKDQGPRASESVNLMKKVLELSETQTAQIEGVLAAGRVQSKPVNDRLSDLKRQLAEEMFKVDPDSSFVKSAAAEIGDLQSKIEMLRFQRFLEVVAVCTPDQKEKLKPIVIEAFGRKPPKEEIVGSKQHRENPERGREERREAVGPPKDDRRPPLDGRPAPPSLEERMAKYVDRLNLTEEQIPRVRLVLQESRQESEQQRARVHPEPGEIEAAKERIRKVEDASIMEILNPVQKAEFARMIAKRRN